MNNRLAITLSATLLMGMAVAQEQAAPPQTSTPETTTMTPQKATSGITSLPTGTAMKMKLETAISTTMSKVGDNFAGRVTENVVLNGKTVIPVGSSIQGRVTRLEEPRRIHGRPTIEMRPEVVTLPNGDKMAIIAVVTQTSDLHTDGEGRIQGNGIDHRDKLEMVAGAGGGAGAGALITHSMKGAVIGTVIAGSTAVVHWLSKSHSAELMPGTEITLELSRAMAITPGSAD